MIELAVTAENIGWLNERLYTGNKYVTLLELRQHYTGLEDVIVHDFIDLKYQDGKSLLCVADYTDKEEGLIFKPIATCNGYKGNLTIKPFDNIQLKLGKDLKPLNREQAQYVYCLLNDDIKCIVVKGLAGSGKTLLSMGAAAKLYMDGDFSNNLVIARPPVSPSKKFDQGFLPGSIEEKMKPWMKMFYDQLDRARTLMGIGKMKLGIEEQSLEYIKGSSFDNCIIIVDEVEDLNDLEFKAIMTRVGNGSKLLLLGDEEQSTEKGCKGCMDKLISKFRSANLPPHEQKLIAFVELVETQRSPFVSMVLKVL
jgi:predicted ribonuclease YlaK